ncbi:MAG: SpaA isopeptide-forming pilin-related protein [Trueperella sp.]|uniref:SpaA isopeptide-forming pilin-related protein n=1 Tax=Trueperella sp. TaxID=2699835 RepID=UPI002A912957|nr:SpaA isopeptide-forming pilin-related protein [Trueperella sp.]MDY5403325.1 SpaA isopeptide-forming pilin-related protein [Trueperella sp.]
MSKRAERVVAHLRALAALMAVAGLALVGGVPAAVAQDSPTPSATVAEATDTATQAGDQANPAGGADTESADPGAAESTNPSVDSSEEAAPETPSVDNSAGGGQLPELTAPDTAEGDTEADPQEGDPSSAEPNSDELEDSGPLMFAALGAAGSAPGIEALSTNGELYLVNPATADITPLPPYLPGIQNLTTYTSANTRREVRVPLTMPACKNARTTRTDDRYCYFSKGMNYNALGVGEDGTRYATLKIGQSKTPYEGKPGSSRAPLFQVYKYTPGDTEWSKFGDEFEFPYSRVLGGNAPNDLTFNGGQVAPDGTYYLAVTDREGPANDKRLVAHVYRMTPDGTLEKVGDVRDSSPGGSNSDNNGDLTFTESGDLVVAFSHLRLDIPGSSQVGYNEVSFEVVTRETLDSAWGGELASYHLGTSKIRENQAKYEENYQVTATTGISIGPDGTLITSNFKSTDSISHFYRHHPGGIAQEIRSMSLEEVEPSPEIPEDVADSVWAPPYAMWVSLYNYNGGATYYQPQPWVGQISDLAGEAVIPSVAARKVVDGRVDADDQFTVKVATNEISRDASTSGEQTEVTTQRLPVLAGTQVTLSETIDRPGATLEGYTITLRCDGGVQPTTPEVSGATATASVVIPNAVGDVVCTFTNTAKANGEMEWAKVNEDGELLPGSSWTLAREDGATFTLDGATQEAASFTVPDATAPGGIDQDTEEGQLLLTGLERGTYTLTEAVAPAGYVKSDKTYTFTISSSQEAYEVDLYDGQDPVESENSKLHNAVVNTPITGSLTFEKRAKQGAAATGDEPLLSGSEWELTNTTTNDAWTITDCVGNSPADCERLAHNDTDSRAGIIQVTGLPLGTYELVETKAPAGYVLDATPTTFTIDADNPDVTFAGAKAIYNTLQAGPTIPLTGGIGRDFYAFLGAGVLGFALLIRLTQSRKRN